ncbi:glycosyltransferase [Streptosporangium saharense]|uniref:glycosyltransferase n=1 Tax=Streptosporangium saharense TaxID=1706840 RepID=UPI0036738779
MSRETLGCHIGFEESPAVLARLREGTNATWTDLDAVPADHVIAKETDALLVLARTPADLRRAVPYGTMLPRVRTLTVMVAESPPWRLPPVPVPDGAVFWRALRDVRVRGGRPPACAWRVEAVFGKAVSAGEVLRAVARGMGGVARETLHGPVVSLAGTGAAHWRPGDPNATPAPLSGPVPPRRDAPGSDLSLRTAGPAWQGDTLGEVPAQQGDVSTHKPGAPVLQGPEPIDRPEPARHLVPARPASGTDRPVRLVSGGSPPDGPLTPDLLAPVDERSVCPVGFLPAADGPVAELTERTGAHEIAAGDVVVRVPLSGALTDTDVARLRGLAGVTVDLTGELADRISPLGLARTVCGLAAAGVPVVATPTGAWRDLLGAELAGVLDGFAVSRLADALDREQYSVRLRRCALDLHGVAGRWRALATMSGLRAPAPTTVSVLLCTRRPDMVGFALRQAGRQRGPEVEVVLTLHGFQADHPDVAAAVSAYKGTVTVIEADGRMVFGDALNQAAERASGAWLTKMDDDDWYGPDHLSDLLLAQRYSAADLVGSAPEFVYLERIGVTVRRDMATELCTGVVAGGTMLLSRAAFDDAGGFRPIPRTVDGQLLQSVTAAGGRVYRTHGLNYILRRREASGHTWQEPINAFLRSFRRQWRGFHANPLMEMEGLSATGERDEA